MLQPLGVEAGITPFNFPVTVTDHENSFFLASTLFDKVTKDMTIYREEIFGSVLACIRAESFSERVELINITILMLVLN